MSAVKMTPHERAARAAAARWSGERSRGVRIYIDADAAAVLRGLRPSEKRRLASEAIRKAARLQ